ncbi:uncharacterized protein [Diadema antillarum]|uniref:uncharacterized protein n=1 Tax=Diadema antillarum TaxID=105358 RepID=UPI003A8A3923
MSVIVGTRVVRGPNWEYGDKLAEEGHVGTVIEVKQALSVTVIWDNGNRNDYRAGSQGRFDLCVYDNAPTGVIHQGMHCSGCGQESIRGIRWQCYRCYDFNLCQPCFNSGSHAIGHEFLRLVSSDSQGTKLYSRNSARQVEARGLFPGAQVQRGKDWRYGDQDGGDSRRLGYVIDVRSWQETAYRGAVAVRWPGKYEDKMYRYRVGADGKVDLKSIRDGSDGSYYPDILPKLGEDDDIRVHDSAVIAPNKESKNCLPPQKTSAIQEVSGKECKVLALSDKGMVTVSVQATDEPRILEVPSFTLRKVPSFHQGDKVQIVDDVEDLARMLDGKNELQSIVKRIKERQLSRPGIVMKAPDKAQRLQVKIGDEVQELPPVFLSLVETGQREAGAQSHPGGGPRSLRNPRSSTQMEERKLSQAAACGHIKEIRKILEANPSLVDSAYSGRSPMQVAAHQGHLEAVKVLMQYKPSLDYRDSDGDTALLYAAYGNNMEIMKYMIDHCKEAGVTDHQTFIDVRQKQQRTCLHVSARRGNLDCVQLLLDRGCSCNLQDKAGDLALHDAIHKDKRDVVKYLVEWPQSDLTMCNKKGLSPLHYAALRGNKYATTCLVTHEPSLINMLSGYDGQTALHIAVSNNFEDVVGELIKGKCDLEVTNYQGNTPLLQALSGGHIRIVIQLVEAGARLSAVNQDGETCLHLAAVRSRHFHSPEGESSILRLLSKEIDKSLLDKPGANLLFYLIKKGAKIAQENDAGDNPLQYLRDSALKDGLLKFSQRRQTSLEDTSDWGEQQRVFNLPQEKIGEEKPVSPEPMDDTPAHFDFEGVHRVDYNELDLHESLGKGSFGQVYRGRWRGTQVAIKKLPLEGSSRSQVEKEVAIHKQATHPNIVQLMALGYNETNAFLVMAFIKGPTLHEAIFSKTGKKLKLTTTQKNTMSRDILSAVAFMHSTKLIHLDIKPGNILLEHLTLKPYLCDLGLSHLKQQAEMSSSTMITGARGTYMYMAPELVLEEERGGSFTGAQDVWSVASTLVELFGETQMYDDKMRPVHLIRRFMHGKFEPESLKSVEPAHRKILTPCFSGKSKDRPSAMELLEQFEELCEDS